MKRLALLALILACLAGPVPASAAGRYGSGSGYRNPLGYRHAYWSPVYSVVNLGIVGAPLHGLVCSRGTIAELAPAANAALYLDGAAVGLPGYRCLHFR